MITTSGGPGRSRLASTAWPAHRAAPVAWSASPPAQPAERRSPTCRSSPITSRPRRQRLCPPALLDVTATSTATFASLEEAQAAAAEVEAGHVWLIVYTPPGRTTGTQLESGIGPS